MQLHLAIHPRVESGRLMAAQQGQVESTPPHITPECHLECPLFTIRRLLSLWLVLLSAISAACAEHQKVIVLDGIGNDQSLAGRLGIRKRLAEGSRANCR